MKKVVSLTALLRFCLAVFITNSMVSAKDIDDKDFLLLQSQKEATYKAISENKENPLNSNENSIDPDHYFTAGGDAFIISVLGLPSVRYAVTVNQQGDLYIPELGLLKLGRITLAEAQKKIAAYVQEKLKKQNEIYVQITRLKSVTVSVNGAVENPGTYVLSGGHRILDAIRTANKETTPSMSNCNFREILCTNRDSVKRTDMFEYLLKNNNSGNPYLYPGDNITLLYTTRKVLLNAMTKSGINGWVPIKENETMASLLSFLRFDFSVDTAIIYYQSMEENGSRSMKTISWNDAEAIVLHDKDIITLPEKKNYFPVFMVSIAGEVARPGNYSIVRESTTAQELLDLAGGPTPVADIDRAVIIRKSKVEQGQKTGNSATTGKPQEISAFRPEMMSAMQKMSVTYDFSIIELKRFGISTKLEESDRVFVPAKERFVYISGSVKRPGPCEFVAGKTKGYYISKAGGYTGKASRSNVFGVRYYEQVSQQTDLNEIREGDIIVVPDSQQGKTLSTLIFPLIGVVLGAVGTVFTIYINTK